MEARSEVAEIVRVRLHCLVMAVVSIDANLWPFHAWHMLGDLSHVFQDPCGIDVNDEDSSCSLTCPVCRDNAVNVLRRGNDKRDVLLITDDLENLLFHCLFVGE